MKEREELKHESYAVISAHRFNGGDRCYYGSKIPHDHGIELEICESHAERSIHNTHYYEGKKIISVKMTEVQFAELITGLNAVREPCTLTYRDGKSVPPPQLEDTRRQFEEDTDKHLRNLAALLQEAKDTLNGWDEKKSVTKTDRAELKRKLDNLQTKLVSDTPYIKDCFERTMDKVVLEYKNEAQAFIKDNLQGESVERVGRLLESQLGNIKTIKAKE